MPLEPGDIVTTGTPAGRKTKPDDMYIPWLKSGDFLRLERQ